MKREVFQSLRWNDVEGTHNLTWCHFLGKYVFLERMRYHAETSIVDDGTLVTEVPLHVETKEGSETVGV